MDPRLTHLDAEGAARMVDVGGKRRTARLAEAEAVLRMSPQAAAAIAAGDAPKGDVIGTARLAGIMAAKRTAELIPLAHPISLRFVDVQARLDVEAGTLVLTAEARADDVTGVEMEAMTACAVAALTVYDMAKGLERGIEIQHVRLLKKHGGRSDWRRAEGERRQDGDGEPRALMAALLTISTSRAEGSGQEDRSGPALRSIAERLGLQVTVQEVLPDSFELIQQRLCHLADVERCALILTSGGTGLAPTDLTPEATTAVLERPAPGLAEAIRAASREHTPHWALSRGVAGVRGRCLIVNLPGSPAAVQQAGEAILGTIPHALELLASEVVGH